jgi:hypothetical protein
MIKKEEFIKRSNNIHNNYYDYSLIDYKNTHTKVKIICPNHGIFEQSPHTHLYSGCPSCAGLKKSTKEEFIKKANNIHNNKYDYSLVHYKNSATKIKIICPEHGIFVQSPNNHINKKQGCPKCIGRNKTVFEITNDLNKIHKNKYNYDFSNYKNKHSKIKITCPIHGIFNQLTYQHFNGVGCPKCAGCKKKTTEEFIVESNNIHNFKYDYSLVNYKSAHKKIKIICPEHGIFEQTPNSHLRGNKCMKCELNLSKGEFEITKYLKENNIIFIPQHTFINCKNIRCLPFDFYLSDYNMCIEFDGEQHFKTSKVWGGQEKLKLIQLRDQIKTDFCKNNNIKLVRIKYNENILDKLASYLNMYDVNSI